ncbi:class I SAM-dependent methyltransferase [Candidatus Woesearchaeota archaeon]|nr:class I SAM-dependent methyltransferase [Candidatus Woesearchaeota archaeon]
MTEGFIAPCSEQYGCSPDKLKLYSRDTGKVDFVICEDCGIIWRDLATCSQERTYDDNYFNRMGYEKERKHKVKRAHLLLALLEQFVQPGRLLEVGCGPGYNLEAAMERGWKSEGLDISEHVVKLCKERSLDVEMGDFSNNDKASGSYDAIFLRHILEHYKDPFSALNKVWDLLKHGGYLQIIIPNAEHRKARLLKDKYKFYNYDFNGTEHYVYFTRKTLKNILKHCALSKFRKITLCL